MYIHAINDWCRRLSLLEASNVGYVFHEVVEWWASKECLKWSIDVTPVGLVDEAARLQGCVVVVLHVLTQHPYHRQTLGVALLSSCMIMCLNILLHHELLLTESHVYILPFRLNKNTEGQMAFNISNKIRMTLTSRTA